MGTFWGLIVIVLTLVCWGGQAVSWFAPTIARRLSLTEDQDAVEPAYHADIRGEALWDTFTLWTLLVAGVLLVVDSPAWAYFGLVGGGMYAYFAGRGIFTRIALRRGGFRVGTAQNVTAAYAFLAIWGVMALITIVAAVVALPTP